MLGSSQKPSSGSKTLRIYIYNKERKKRFSISEGPRICDACTSKLVFSSLGAFVSEQGKRDFCYAVTALMSLINPARTKSCRGNIHSYKICFFFFLSYKVTLFNFGQSSINFFVFSTKNID